MARIKIKDLPKDRKVSKEEMKLVLGGAITWVPTMIRTPVPTSPVPSPYPNIGSSGVSSGSKVDIDGHPDDSITPSTGDASASSGGTSSSTIQQK